jgi:hypothetical protein
VVRVCVSPIDVSVAVVSLCGVLMLMLVGVARPRPVVTCAQESGSSG